MFLFKENFFQEPVEPIKYAVRRMVSSSNNVYLGWQGEDISGVPRRPPAWGALPAYRVARPMAIDILIGYLPPTLAQTAAIASSTIFVDHSAAVAGQPLRGPHSVHPDHFVSRETTSM